VSLSTQTVLQVQATVETDPVPTDGDAADDAAFWIHPYDTALSVVVGTDKRGGGLAIYDLAGRTLQYDASVEPNNVDIRYNFPLGGDSVAIVGFSNEDNRTIGVYAVEPGTRTVYNVVARTLKPGAAPYGFCLYRSPLTNRYYGFVTSKSGVVEQWELFDNGVGKVDGLKVRSFNVGSQIEACVADDVYAALYVGEENVGIWRYGAEPGDGSARTQVDTTAGGHVEADVEGLTIYYASDGTGYLIASSQGASEFVIYERTGSNPYLATFRIVSGERIDGVNGTDGIDVVNFPLGAAFPEGAFVAQDGSNDGGNQNFKLVPWGSIARAAGLKIDVQWDPRQLGGGAGGNRAPGVDAGPDQEIAFPDPATLSGTVTDDGLPTPAITMSWSQVSGPGPVQFADAAAAATTVEFPQPGIYVLRLTASDGELSASDDVRITVVDPSQPTVVEIRVAANSDDAEETASRSVKLSSSDLELVYDGGNQTVGVRFVGVNVPRGAAIVRAYVQFQVDEATSTATSLTIQGQAADNAPTFVSATGDVSSRPRTTAAAAWSPPAWLTIGAAGPDQRTSDLSAVIQEIVNRAGWAPGNALVLVFTGAGKRVAEARDGDKLGAPLLHVEYLP
jgi:3-phytase